jgi:hypothetical protein
MAEAEIRPYDPTKRERTQAAIADLLQSYGLAGSNYQAQKLSKNITGTMDENAPLMGIGLMDFTPAGLVFAVDEIYRDFSETEGPVDYIAPVVGGALSALEAYPLTKAVVKPIKAPVVDFFDSFSKKLVAD